MFLELFVCIVLEGCFAIAGSMFLNQFTPLDHPPRLCRRCQGQGPAGSEVAWHPGFPCDRPTACHYRTSNNTPVIAAASPFHSTTLHPPCEEIPNRNENPERKNRTLCGSSTGVSLFGPLHRCTYTARGLAHVQGGQEGKQQTGNRKDADGYAIV